MTVDHYRYWLEQTAQGGFRAHFPDLADFQVEAHTLARLFPMLHDGVVGYLEEYLKSPENLAAPEPLPARFGEEVLSLRPTIAAKLALIERVKKGHLTGAELSRRLDCLPQEAARILKLSHPTKIDTMMSALNVVGVTLRVEMLIAEPPQDAT